MNKWTHLQKLKYRDRVLGINRRHREVMRRTASRNRAWVRGHLAALEVATETMLDLLALIRSPSV